MNTIDKIKETIRELDSMDDFTLENLKEDNKGFEDVFLNGVEAGLEIAIKLIMAINGEYDN